MVFYRRYFTHYECTYCVRHGFRSPPILDVPVNFPSLLSIQDQEDLKSLRELVFYSVFEFLTSKIYSKKENVWNRTLHHVSTIAIRPIDLAALVIDRKPNCLNSIPGARRGWLHADLINAYLGLVHSALSLRRVAPRVHFPHSSIYSNLVAFPNNLDLFKRLFSVKALPVCLTSLFFLILEEFFDFDAILIPVHLHDCHWTLCVLWPKRKEICHLDSDGAASDEVMKVRQINSRVFTLRESWPSSANALNHHAIFKSGMSSRHQLFPSRVCFCHSYCLC